MEAKSQLFETIIYGLGGVQKGEFTTAAGKRANRKIEMDVLDKNKLFRGLVIRELGRIAHQYEPDTIVPVPHGVDSISQDIAERLGINSIVLDWANKAPGQKRLQLQNLADKEALDAGKGFVLIDDVFTTGSSLQAVANMEGIEGKVQAAVVVWDRSDPAVPHDMPFPVESIVTKHVPLWVNE